LSDGQRLDPFLAAREEAAFAALVRRHGPMVLGICRRVLGNLHDAEDAFQATFLVLVRRAAAIVPRDRVGHWLYRVAYRTSLEAKGARAQRQAKEGRVIPRPSTPNVRDEAAIHPLKDQKVGMHVALHLEVEGGKSSCTICGSARNGLFRAQAGKTRAWRSSSCGAESGKK
jgi:RNA polymerase sigma-70 factor (ECF subfamily)